MKILTEEQEKELLDSITLRDLPDGGFQLDLNQYYKILQLHNPLISIEEINELLLKNMKALGVDGDIS